MRSSINLEVTPKILLENELVFRTQKNPNYSLRRFAKAIGISHSALSFIMSGKRALSRKAAERVAIHLGLSPAETEILLKNRKANLVNHRKPALATLKPDIAASFKNIDLATFELISSWIHYAILSLLEIPRSKFQPRWIAKRLGVSQIQARCAMERLKDLGFITRVGRRWRQTGLRIKVENDISTAATRRFHRQLLEKAMESLENDSMEKRDFSSMTMAIDPELIPYARERIKNFRRELTRELTSQGTPKTVYNLTVQIYPVSR